MEIPELTLLQAVVLMGMLVETGVFLMARKLVLSDAGYRIAGGVALCVGAPLLLWLGGCLATSLWHSEWRAAGEHGLLTYVMLTATWLGWKETKPF